MQQLILPVDYVRRSLAPEKSGAKAKCGTPNTKIPHLPAESQETMTPFLPRLITAVPNPWHITHCVNKRYKCLNQMGRIPYDFKHVQLQPNLRLRVVEHSTYNPPALQD